MKEYIIRVIDKIFSTNITCSLGDILLQGNILDNGQLTILSRFYDVNLYKNGEDKSFPFQNALSYITWGERHDRITGDSNFEKLIASYEKTGYRKGSRIILYKGIQIANGTHRMALNLYHKIWDIESNVMWRKLRNQKNIEWYINKGLDPKWVSILEDTKKKVDNILFNEGATFVMVVDVKKMKHREKLEIFLKDECKCFRIVDYAEKIIVRFSLYSPEYVVKKGGLYSKSAARIFELISRMGINVVNCTFNCSDGMRLYQESLINKNAN